MQISHRQPNTSINPTEYNRFFITTTKDEMLKVKEWVDENLKNAKLFGLKTFYDSSILMSTTILDIFDPDEAVLFKLTWVGQ